MMESRLINQRARQALRGNVGMAIVIVFLIQVIQGSVSSVFQLPAMATRIFSNAVNWESLPPQEWLPRVMDEQQIFQASTLGFLSTLVTSLLSVLFASYQSYAFQAPIRNRKLTLEEGIQGFREAGTFRAIRTALRTLLFTWLWSLLFVIPGIVKSYAYSQAIYLVRDYRELSPRQPVEESQELMRGRKGMLFGLHFRYWILPILIFATIAVLAVFAVISFITEQAGIGFLLIIPIFLGVLGLIVSFYYVSIKIAMVNAAFYETLMETRDSRQSYRGGPMREEPRRYTDSYERYNS